MEHKNPSYEEYSKATKYAKIRYNFGVYIQAIALFLFLLVLVYAVINIEEMKTNPKDYAEKRLGVVCNYPLVIENTPVYYNGSYRNITSVEEW